MAQQNRVRQLLRISGSVLTICYDTIRISPDPAGRHPAHAYAVTMEAVVLAPKSEVSIYPWKEPTERIPLAVHHIHSLLQAHRPALGSGVGVTLTQNAQRTDVPGGTRVSAPLQRKADYTAK
jgi:hypothetical protein